MIQKTMQIGILQTGDTPEELKTRHGGYEDMFIRLLGGNGMNFNFQVFRVLDQEFPEDVSICDGWLITGSKHAAYGPEPWIPPLKKFIREIVAADLPLAGICFGHQIIAEALGGRVVKSDKGWGLGLDTYDLDPELAAAQPPQVTLNIFHQDQVIEAPTGARIYARSDFCENAGMLVGNRIMTIQGHPEFKVDYNRELLAFRRDSVEPETLVDCAIEELGQGEQNTDSERFGAWIGQFFNDNARRVN